MPATKLLAKVYQLYIVENQRALMLMSQSQGTTEATVSANHTIYTAAHTVFLKIYFFASPRPRGVSSIERESWRIFQPKTIQRPMVSIVLTVKKPGERNPLFPFSASSWA